MPSDCNFNKRLPQEFIDALKRKFNEPPTGVWADYNCMYKRWLMLKGFSGEGQLPVWANQLLCNEDVPDMPNISNYTDLDAPKTEDGC